MLRGWRRTHPSSYMRRTSQNQTLVAALNRWQIREWHVYHLWWQRWRYLAWAVELGYNAMSLDTDISLRANPYACMPVSSHACTPAASQSRGAHACPRA